MVHRRKIASEAKEGHKRDFYRENGQDELRSSLMHARDAFQSTMVNDAAAMAECLDPELRRTGRKILGIDDSESDPESEARIATMKKVLDGEPYAMFALARQMIENDEVDGDMRVQAGALVCMHAIMALKMHAIEPTRGAKEKELMESLESLSPQIISLISDDLAIIAKRSPYESVRSTAKAMVDHTES